MPTTPETVDATIVTDDGAIGLSLDNGKSPCTVNNFVSLAQQGFFDQTSCHRLTTSNTLGVLQCGDPAGDGNGGPGYRFPNEYPTNQYRLADPALETPVVYPRGTLAMANSGQGTNGSQFFLVYEDSELPPTYTVFGAIDDTGLAVVDRIAAGGVQGRQRRWQAREGPHDRIGPAGLGTPRSRRATSPPGWRFRRSTPTVPAPRRRPRRPAAAGGCGRRSPAAR